MKVVILGAGTVGRSIAESLSNSRHGVTIVDRNPTIARDLNRVSGMNPALISRGIRRLELRELIFTQRDEHDRRTQRLELTPEGQKLYQQTLPIMGRRHEAHCACMNKEELELFKSILDKLEAQTNIQDFQATENQED